MSTTKEHLHDWHEGAAEHHTTKARSHHEHHEVNTALAKAFPDHAEHFKKAAAAHKRDAASHEARAEYHLGECKALKAAISNDLNKLMPDRFSVIAPSDAPDSAFGIRAVVRPGQPEFSKATLDAIPAEFRHLVEISDE